MRRYSAFLYLFYLIPTFLSAQRIATDDYSSYIRQYKSMAIKEMKLYKIPASITLAQGMIESGCGKSVLALDSKNHFGIKCQKDWNGETYLYDDDQEKECFRKYNSVEESYRDHSLFLSTRKRYAQLFTLPITDYKGWANGLKLAGYATNPDYPNMLIRLIESNQLYLLDDTLSSKRAEISLMTPEGKTKTVKVEKNKTEAGRTEKFTHEGIIKFRKSYVMPDASQFKFLYTSDAGRRVYENCGVPFVFAKKDDTWFSIAKEFKIYAFQVHKQNDLQENDIIIPGQMLYLEPKKRKNAERTYTISSNDCLYSVSQEKCVKLPLLMKYNKLQPGDEPEPGFELKLAR